ncbi:MAG: carboxypeptidase regulatory-like domain-containing protein [Kofleriaceae bacterium]
MAGRRTVLGSRVPGPLVSAALAIGVVGATAIGPSIAHADDATTGGVRGLITDSASRERPFGAIVEATSAGLQGSQTTMVDELGRYYLTSLPPGNYTLTVYYNTAKFTRGNVVVQLGKEVVVNITVDGRVAKGEIISIVGNTPLIDQGSTKIGQTFTPDYTNNLPTAGTFGGTVVGAGGAQRDAHGISFAGATSAENTYVIEGLNTTDTGFGTLSSDLPNELIQEAEVITGGYNAEYGRATGAIVNVITKSGGNELHGSVFGHYEPGAFTASATTIRREGTAIDAAVDQDYRYDLGAELGGPIVPDKLWFHLGFAPSTTRTTTTRIVSSNVDADNDGVPDQDASTGFTEREEVARRSLPSTYKTYFLTAKLTGVIADDHRWQITGWGNPQRADAVSATVRDPLSSVQHTEQGAYDVSAKWTSKLDQGAFQIDAVVGFHHGFNRVTPLHASEDVPAVRYDYTRSLYDFADLEGAIDGCRDGGPTDRYPSIVNCPVLSYTDQGLGFLEDRTNDRISAQLALTRRWRLLGQHVSKLGIDVERSTYNSGRRFSGGAFIARSQDDATPDHPMPLGSYLINQYVQTDAAGNVPCGADVNGDGVGDARCSVSAGLDANTHDRSIAAYLQDSWQLTPSLTINLGLRWEQQVGYVASFLQGTTSPDTGEVIGDVGFQLDHLIAPRLGFIFDPTEQGRAKLMGHWGRFYENVPGDLNVRSFAGETILSSNSGVNANGQLDGSCAFDHGTPMLATQVLGCVPGSAGAFGGGSSYVAPGLEGQYTQELILGAEFQIMPALTVSATYVHRSLPSVIEDMSTDGGATFLIANPGANYDADADKLDAQAAQLMTGSDADQARASLDHSRAEQLRAVKRFDPPTRNYDALQLTARTRPTPHGLLLATYTYARAKGNYPGLFSTDTPQLDPNVSTQYDLPDLMPNRYGPTGLDRPHSLKVDGFYQLDLKQLGFVVLGASWRVQSGIPSATLAAHPVYGQGESYLLPRGSVYRSPVAMTVDTHVSYGYQLSPTRRIEGFVEIFNLFDQQPEVAVDPTYSTDSALPIVGGDAADLAHAKVTQNGRQVSNTVTKNLNYGKTSVRQAPLTAQLGFRLTF